MSDRATAANEEVLRWARQSLNYSVEEVASRIGKSPDAIRDWEEGRSAPTYVQLETLAESVYERPVAIFFFPDPPEEEPLEGELRTLPEADRERLPPAVRLQLRKAKSYMLSLEELTGGVNPAEHLIWRDFRPTLRSDIPELADSVREYLGVDLEMQRGWPSTRVAMREWRRAVESAGVFIFKDNFGSEQISGFCLYDSEFPVIMVNNQNTFTRQIFTVFHELAHILLGLSGVTPDDLSYAADIENAEDRRVEVTCNSFAAEVLVPSGSFPLGRIRRANDSLTELERMAREYSVSREVLLRRLLDAGLVPPDTYEELADRWSSQRSAGGSGGNYYYTQMAYLGESYLGLAMSRYRSGDISRSELADHLGMKAENVDTMQAKYLE